MDNLENFPCYDHSVLTDFSFQAIQPVSVTLPYDKALSVSKLIKKKVDKTKGDLVVYSFHHHTKPNVSDGDVLMVELLKDKIDLQVLLSYNHIYKGHRVFSCVCQIQ
ncbi:hypothetical protein ABK836_12485 [Enterobacter hormaechei]|uniref:hypothetical protein n=1 Tax=Enterobacter hormaechei TaxID=158836 RepID=UPI0011130B51|nr:hypothetical protein [Enterobacter hormaechei]QLU71456.1 hypothetical protein HV217_08885 [Enterobacter cloacae]QLU91581.1 hypothetical protein HV266_08460 [Enterobacter roggenkampii]HED3657350.1 hypothetical protein [Enterobacter hormaechei subsp. hoffmannii]MBJ6560266.1 hypothetical protein [Enterobacter hormaechei]QLN58208.1 hypothetical protein HV067_08200 [Enterobacter hormaechei]